ncbi:matrix metalloproteinase-25 [Erpetoichthys calabaricus]|uniref:Peptidase metallopeptidase domain-containing protein n=1 Tax=Erpetoichthys calabaricus TaxID=27687 RepID=A0A8C4SC27_ERPCA|nr:matrix metalloproteinase-25 [Erpetoichthys calabaricus]
MTRFILGLLLASVVVGGAKSERPQSVDVSKGVDWLTRYGYLPPPDPMTAQLQTREGIEEAIRTMQRFGGLKETGQMDAATLALMQKPRCSLPDIIGTSELLRRRRRRRRYALSGLLWQKKSLTWKVHTYPKSEQNKNLDSRTIDSIMYYALKVWGDAVPLTFQQLSPRGSVTPDIVVDFSSSYHDDGYPFDGAGGTLAHAFFPGEHPISGDTHFDDEETWTILQQGADQGTDLYTVAIHEFGHALGLAHSSSSSSIMAPYYQGPVGHPTTFQLHTDDLQGIQQLYGRKDSPSKPTTQTMTTPALPKVPSQPPPRATRFPQPNLPNRCLGGFDAIANIRGEVFFFKNEFFWRIQRTGSLVSLNPAQVSNFWKGLPKNFKKIDAVYERPGDSKIVFIIRDQYWLFKDTTALPGYPRSLTEFGLPSGGVDAAFIWAHNGKTYFFRGKHFWRYDEQKRTMDQGYPKEVSLWQGIPEDLDDVISWGEAGDTYFFKGNEYWIQKKGGIDQAIGTSKSVAVDWMRCSPRPTASQPPVKNPRSKDKVCTCDFNAGTGLLASTLSYWLVILFVLPLMVSL